MNHRKFVVASTVSLLVVAAFIVGLSFYSGIAVKASVPNLPEALSYLPADSQVVFGMNVQSFVKSPIFIKFQEKHGQEIGSDLQDFITRTGVDPVNDLSYIVASGRAGEQRKGSGAVIAVAKKSFNIDTIVSYIKTKTTPVESAYNGVQVLMFPESNGSKPEKGVAFLKNSEIALGGLDTLKSVVDASAHPKTLGLEANTTLMQLISSLDSGQMFWFAGDAASILSKAPTDTPLGGSISSIQSVVGTLNLDDAVVGKITATAKDAASARKLSDVVRGFVALGQLASDQTPELAQLLNGLTVTLDNSQVSLSVNFPYDLLEKLQQVKHSARAQAKKI